MKNIPANPADAIVEIMTRLYENGLTTTSGGNLSVSDDEGMLWISPSGVDKARLRREDVMRVMADGMVLGPHRVSTECPFHLAIRRVRPELRAVLHAHPGALVSFSLMRRIPNLSIIPGVAELCGRISMAKYALPGSSELGGYIAGEFARGHDTVMLENHGVVIGAQSLERAYMMLEELELCARMELGAAALGSGCRTLSEAQLRSDSPDVEYPDSLAHPHSEAENDIRRELAALIARSCSHKLFGSASGVISARLPEGGFIITPYRGDNRRFKPDDLVRVSRGECEAGKRPSREAGVIAEIFDAHPDVMSVIVARPPEIMSFAVGGAAFDSRLIPESYICLKEINRYPFGVRRSDRCRFIGGISMRTPIAIIENDAVIVAGASPLDAFDRLEVMEFGAYSIRQIKQYGGEVVRIDDSRIREIEVAFNL